MKRALPALLAALALAAAAPPAPIDAAAVAAPQAAFGEPIADCEFVDVRFARHGLEDFGPQRAFVICFLRVDCPLAPRNLRKLEALWRRNERDGVQFLGVDVGAEDTVIAAAGHALDHGATFPIVRDVDLSTARACGATRAGEVVVLDGERRLRYRGRVDSEFRVGGESSQPGREDLALAIAQVLAGRAPTIAQTRAEGCLITPAPAPEAGVTWVDHVAPLVARECAPCHQPGGDAPFSLLDWSSAASHAAMIAEVVEWGRMPPWHAAPGHGRFRNERGLTSAERRLLIDWAKGGAPRGAPDSPPLSVPPVARSSDGWRIGEPDLVVKTATRMNLPATGVLPYQYALLPYVFLEETWVAAVEIRASNPRVMHHCNLAHVRVGEEYRTENFITGQVPGGDPLVLEPGVAVRIPAGSILALQIHYVTSGKVEQDEISVALRYPRFPVQKQMRHFEIADFRFTIPPHASAHPVSAAATFDVDAIGIGMFVHMHTRGRDMRFEALAPDAAPETLLLVPTYDFDWQASYRWFPGRQRFAAGTRVHCLAHYDNSRFNPFNPDPAASVRFGQQTTQEMMYGFLFWVAADEHLHLDVDPTSGRARS